ncbi:MAG: IMPACT family protein [Bacillota bacterium]
MEFIAPMKQAKIETVIKKSRFIGHVFPAFSEEEALGHIESVKIANPAATHNVYAYSVGIGTFAERASDDGEPRGTAGYPVLDVIKKRELRNVVCVITRYFGGTKLGAGGLVRAYSNAASMALDQAGLAVYMYHDFLTAIVDYDQFGRVQREIEIAGSFIHNISYTDKVTVEFFAIPETAPMLQARIRDITSGLGNFTISEGKYIPIREVNP